MSFAGHVFDMIRRSKENRDLLHLRRERAKGNKTYLGKDSTPEPQITLEEYERIDRELKLHEEQQQRYYFRMTVWIAVGAVVICLIGFGLFKFVF